MNQADQNRLEALILGYFDHLEDHAYASSVWQLAEPTAVLAVICNLLQDNDLNRSGSADAFLRDCRWLMSRERPDVIAVLQSPAVFEAYYANAFAQSHYRRFLAVQSLDALDGWHAPGRLDEVAEHMAANDPILLPKLLRHLLQPSRCQDWTGVTRYAQDTEYLVRWSVLPLLRQFVNFPLPEGSALSSVKLILDRLTRDENPVVKQEADFLAEKLAYFEIMPTLPKPEKRKRSKEFNRKDPAITFEKAGMAFASYLSKHHLADYTLPEFHQFVVREMSNQR